MADAQTPDDLIAVADMPAFKLWWAEYLPTVSYVRARRAWRDVLRNAAPPAQPGRAVMQQALDALRGYVGAHAIPSSICKERPAYEAAQAAITALSATMEKI